MQVCFPRDLVLRIFQQQEETGSCFLKTFPSRVSCGEVAVSEREWSRVVENPEQGLGEAVAQDPRVPGDGEPQVQRAVGAESTAGWGVGVGRAQPPPFLRLARPGRMTPSYLLQVLGLSLAAFHFWHRAWHQLETRFSC